MPSIWAWTVFNLAVYATASLGNDETKAFLKLTEFDYEDNCFDTATAEWASINSPSNETLSTWEKKLNSFASYKNIQRIEIANISKDNINDPSLQYKYETAEKAGDALLNSEDYETLVHFAGTVDLVRLSTFRKGLLNNRTRTDIEHALSHGNNVENKSNVWTTWHQELAPLVKNFSTILPLVDKAAKANGAKDVTEYWELLSGYTDGYNQIKYEWNKIDNLHKKILKFVMSNLSHKYKIDINETVPAYLLGSLQGSDWTPVAVDVTPYPNLMYDIKKNLWKRKLIGKSLYKTASAMGTKILHHVPQSNFWSTSQFNQQCPPKLINFCKEGIMRVSTCFEPTLSNFLSAHKTVGKILYNEMTLESSPIFNTVNRYSALEEGVSEFFGILAASPAWLNSTRITDNSTNNDEHLMVSLMITALDTLPRLTYYMAADMWRINAIEKGVTDPTDLVSSWWKYREEYEGVSSNGTETPTFLTDDYITSNKPYLPKLAGTILAFQFYEQLMESTEVRYDSIVGKQMNADFIKMIQRGGADNWMRVIDKFLELDQISSSSLLSFFSPLEDFIDELEDDYEYKPISAKEESELEELENKIIEEMNAPTTTTTTTTTTPRNVIPKRKMTNTTSSSKQNDGRSNINAVDESKKHLQSKSSVHLADAKSGNGNIVESGAATVVPFDESLFDRVEDEEEDTKPKINTSKAVWAVGAVLLAIVVICVIAIFGRQRCRKTPKNRRYV